MKSRWRFLILTLLILGFGATSVYLLGTPRLVDIRPAPGATDVPAGAALQLTFSRPMQAESITKKLDIQPFHSGKSTWNERTFTFTPNQPWPNGETIQIHLVAGARASGWFSFPTRQEMAWSFTIEKPFLLYLYPTNSPSAIYAIDPETGAADKLTNLPGEVFDYGVDASGSVIVYSASQASGGNAIYKLNRLSGENSAILEFPEAQVRYPQISPSGEYLAYERTPLAQSDQPDLSQVWLLPLGEEQNPLPEQSPFAVGEAGHQTQQPFWSPTGLLTFYDATLSAFILYDPQTLAREQIPSQTGQAGVWDPQGRWYLFPEILFNISSETADSTGVTPIPASHLIRYDRMSKSLKDLTLLDNLEDTSPAFSPDGETIVFARKYLNIAAWTPGRQIWLMNADGSHARPITQQPQYNHYAFSWSPTGDRIAYVRFNQTQLTEPPEVWVIHADGSQPQKIVTGGYAPQWIP